MTVAEYIANQLYIKGIRYVFGIPGGPSIPYMRAFKEAGIEFILTANESSAAIMADVSARLTGIPGVCHATFGPGATNITTGVGGALLDRSPVIVLTSEMDDTMILRTTQMNIDHQKLFAPVTKATFRLTPLNAVKVLNEALKICLSDYPGSVHIGLPSDIAGKEISETFVIEPESEVLYKNDDIQDIISILENARSPVMAVGLTAARFGISNELIRFLEKYKMPVVLTPMAKGIIPEDNPCYSGVLFHALSDYLEDIYSSCDLIIGLGYDPVEYNYESWIPDVPLVHFDTKKSDMPPNINAYQYSGMPGSWFEVMSNLKAELLKFDEDLIKGIRSEMDSVFTGFTNHFGPVAALKVLQEELPADSIITADVGSHLHLLGQYWKSKKPGRTLITNGWSGMGFGLPAALAAKLVSGDQTVVCVTGDGGFLMMAGEMITARRHNIQVIVVVFSDGELNLIKLKQSWKDLPPYATIMYQGDLFNCDNFLGIRVLSADSSENMIKAVNTALSLTEPVIINAIINPDDYKWLVVRK